MRLLKNVVLGYEFIWDFLIYPLIKYIVSVFKFMRLFNLSINL